MSSAQRKRPSPLGERALRAFIAKALERGFYRESFHAADQHSERNISEDDVRFGLERKSWTLEKPPNYDHQNRSWEYLIKTKGLDGDNLHIKLAVFPSDLRSKGDNEMVAMNGHRCDDFSEERRATLRRPYHFVGSGLPNVYLVGIRYWVCRYCRKQAAEIPALKGLLKAIARAVVEKDAALTGPEIRFLRKRLEKKAAEFGRMVGVTAEQVSRWENEHNPPEKSADRLIRLLFCMASEDQKLKDKVNLHIEEWLASLTRAKPIKSFRAERTSGKKWQVQPRSRVSSAARA